MLIEIEEESKAIEQIRRLSGVTVVASFEDGSLWQEHLQQVAAGMTQLRQVSEKLSNDETVDMTQQQQAALERTAAFHRSQMKVVLGSLDVDARAVVVNGQRYRRQGREPKVYRTIFGEVRLMRTVYREGQVRNGKTLDLVGLRAGVVRGSWLPLTARNMAFVMQQNTSREAAKLGAQLGQLAYSRSSFEDIAHEVGAKYQAQQESIEQVLIDRFDLDDRSVGVAVSLDRVSVAVEIPRKRAPGRPRAAAPKNPIERVYKMAYCASLTLHDEHGQKVQTIRYGQMHDQDASRLVMRIADDVARLQRHRPLKVSLIADGAHENWKLLEQEFRPEEFPEVISLVDMYHLIEKLAPAAKLLAPDEHDKLLRRWHKQLRNLVSAPDRILAQLRNSQLEDVRVNDTCPVHDAITYLQNHRHRMRYRHARKQGRPIGSGAVEATCKSLVKLRLARPGARWKPHTAEHIIELRALAISDSNRWDQAMDILFTPANHQIREVA